MPPWTVQQIPSQAGKTAVVTGGNSGIGWQTALELVRAGAEVTLAVRDGAKGLEAVERIRAQIPGANVRHELLDLASLQSVRDFSGRWSGGGRTLDLLVNNAGVMAVPTRRLTQDGFELQLGTNYLGVFALTLSLLPALRRAPSARVCTVSSMVAALGPRRIRFEDPQWEKGYNPWTAYCQSKLADLMFMLELGRRFVAEGGSWVSTGAHPGYASTNLQSNGAGRPLNLFEKTGEWLLAQSAARGALPTLRAVTENVPSGSYFGPRFVVQGPPVPAKITRPALDTAACRRLWELSETLTQVRWQGRA